MLQLSVRQFSAILAVVATVSGCSGILHFDGEIGTSFEFEPPRAWESAVLFSFTDSTHFPDHPYAARVELEVQGYGRRVITGRELFQGPGGDLRTPWYRVPPRDAAGQPLVLHIVLTDTSGAESRADYSLVAERDHFYEVIFGVTTPQPPQPQAPSLLDGKQWFPVNGTARRLPTDSLMVAYKFRTRECFDCPF